MLKEQIRVHRPAKDATFAHIIGQEIIKTQPSGKFISVMNLRETLY
jgi:hypothetical protein